jgi:hypothetical protein
MANRNAQGYFTLSALDDKTPDKKSKPQYVQAKAAGTAIISSGSNLVETFGDNFNTLENIFVLTCLAFFLFYFSKKILSYYIHV